MLTSDRMDTLECKGVELLSVSGAVPEKAGRAAARGSGFCLEEEAVAVAVSPEVAQRPPGERPVSGTMGPTGLSGLEQMFEPPEVGFPVRSTGWGQPPGAQLCLHGPFLLSLL